MAPAARPRGNGARKDMARLGVNIDHVATLRQARGGAEPDPVAAAVLCELGGASSIVAHLREDRRHIQDRDVRLLRQTVGTRMDLEMAPTDEMVAIACDVRPDMATLVPERRKELTTEGGLDAATLGKGLAKRVAALRRAGISVSLFVEPAPEQIQAAHKAGADFVEIHTGHYANARGADRDKELIRIREAAARARDLGLQVNAGHGLTYANVAPVAAIPGIVEFNIGHSVMARAVLVGIVQAVRDMAALVAGPAGPEAP
jgi:pyridoxine 5-phosphate synthase